MPQLRILHISAPRIGALTARAAAIALAGALCAGACLVSPQAFASQQATLRARFEPERLGAGTTVALDVQIGATGARMPSPVTALDFEYPANLGIGTSGLGIESCTALALEVKGQWGCPADSLMGYGSAQVEIPIGPDIERETGSIAIYMGPLQEGHLVLLFLADAREPVEAELVFPGTVLPAPAPFGGRLALNVPQVPTLPDARYASLVRLKTTIGPLGIRYLERSHGHTVPYTPRGIVLPHHCPKGGFPFATTLAFEDGTHTTARTAVPCPKRPRARHRRR